MTVTLSLLKPEEGDIWKSFQSKIPFLSGKHPRNPKDVISHSYPGFPFQCFSLQLFPYYLASLDLRA